jgi:outer membrane receptor protein involved in Fe transport
VILVGAFHQSAEAADSAASDAAPPQLTEVVVSAEKREERLQDVPMPVTALDASSLVQSNQLSLQQYFSTVPGLNLTTGGIGDTTLAIRGVTTGGAVGNATIAVLVDDVPVSTSAGALSGEAKAIPDLDPSDLQRVEVLRGPQGTLYGASGLSGVLKFVTTDPSTTQLSGRVEVSGNSVYNGDGLGYGVRGAMNLPLGDTLAIRVSAFGRKDPGYIDDPILQEKGVNADHTEGGHLALLWRPSADFSIKLGALIQNITADGNGISMPELGDLQQAFLRGTGQWWNRAQTYTANINAKLGGVDLISLTGYSDYRWYGIGDFGGDIGLPTSSELQKFSQEIRLSSTIGHSVDWLFGLFYTHELSPVDQHLLTMDPDTGEPTSDLLHLSFPTTYTEYAAFANFTVHFTDRFDVQLGGRESHNDQVFNEIDTGPLVPGFDNTTGTTYVWPEFRSSENNFTYLLTPRLKLSPDSMVYLRIASGYRPGGPNAAPQLSHGTPQFGPDTTKSYELGLKTEVFDHKLSLDGSVYYIDWKNIQLSVSAPNGTVYVTNGGNAKSQGIELSAQATPLEGMTLAAWVAYNDAVLTQPLPPDTGLIAPAGTRLPYSSRYSGYLSIEQQFALGASSTGYVRASANYVGDRETGFSSSALPPVPMGGYMEASAVAGIHYRAWTINCFANNITDKRGAFSTGTASTSTHPDTTATAVFIQPRTIGLSVAYAF